MDDKYVHIGYGKYKEKGKEDELLLKQIVVNM